jgi:hypothetical protein
MTSVLPQSSDSSHIYGVNAQLDDLSLAQREYDVVRLEYIGGLLAAVEVS